MLGLDYFTGLSSDYVGGAVETRQNVLRATRKMSCWPRLQGVAMARRASLVLEDRSHVNSLWRDVVPYLGVVSLEISTRHPRSPGIQDPDVTDRGARAGTLGWSCLTTDAQTRNSKAVLHL